MYLCFQLSLQNCRYPARDRGIGFNSHYTIIKLILLPFGILNPKHKQQKQTRQITCIVFNSTIVGADMILVQKLDLQEKLSGLTKQ